MIKKKQTKFNKFVLGLIFLFIIIGIFIMIALTFWMATLRLPDLESFENRKVIESTKIYDRTGKILLWDIHENIQRTVITSDKISPHLKNATVAIEDADFYKHRGIDFKGIVRAILVNIGSISLREGGSTISQQLVKNSLLSGEKSFIRKTKEVILTLKLERNFSKEKILELYLNEIPYGGNNYGAEAASQHFFGKSASELSLAEAAYLAALPQAPTYYSPFGNHRNELETRKNLVLKKMYELGFITKEEEEGAEKEKAKFIPRGEQKIRAPHFAIHIRSYLEQKYGEDIIEEKGLRVITTLDYNLQAKAEEMVKQYAEENKKKFNASNAAMVGIDPKTGQILVMVGSKNYFNIEEEGNFNVTLAHRQPGSSIKPFVYATALKKGFTPDTIVFDLDTEFNTSCNSNHQPILGTNITSDQCYSPENYDHLFRGPITFRNALAQSVNVPSVKVLYLAGLKESLQTVREMGITSLDDPNRYGLTLVLGGGEVSLLELTGAYSVFANNGVKNPLTGILKIEDSEGNILEEFRSTSEKVLEKNVALLISNILSDNDARAPAFGEASYLYFPDREVAVKTGTTNDYRDAWVIGYTPSFALGVWCGNNDNTPMEKKVAGFIAAPLWHDYFQEVFNNLVKEKFEKPEKPPASKPFLWGDWRGGITYKIDKISKKLATDFTPPELIEEKPIVQIHSILKWITKDDPLGLMPEHPENDPQFILWEKSVRDWAARQNIAEQTMADIPTEYDNIHKPEYIPKINIVSPVSGSIYKKSDILNININYESRFGLDQIDFFLGNNYLGSAKRDPFSFSFTPSGVGVGNEETIRIIAYDKIRNKTETGVPVKFTD
ncbi:MAG: PBP1A family penicillin-binding protein [Patescibacteria group bacterium]